MRGEGERGRVKEKKKEERVQQQGNRQREWYRVITEKKERERRLGHERIRIHRTRRTSKHTPVHPSSCSSSSSLLPTAHPVHVLHLTLSAMLHRVVVCVELVLLLLLLLLLVGMLELRLLLLLVRIGGNEE